MELSKLLDRQEHTGTHVLVACMIGVCPDSDAFTFEYEPISEVPDWYMFELEHGYDFIADSVPFLKDKWRGEPSIDWFLKTGLLPGDSLLLCIDEPAYHVDYWGEHDVSYYGAVLLIEHGLKGTARRQAMMLHLLHDTASSYEKYRRKRNRMAALRQQKYKHMYILTTSYGSWGNLAAVAKLVTSYGHTQQSCFDFTTLAAGPSRRTTQEAVAGLRTMLVGKLPARVLDALPVKHW